MSGQRLSRDVLPPRWDRLKYHPQQAAAFHSKARFVNLACGRRSGKTEIARRKIVTSLAIRKPWARPIYFYALPTYAQAKKVAWKELMDLIPKSWIVTANVMDLYVQTIFGSELYVVGMDQPQRIEGLGYDGGVIDEACDHKPGSFHLSIRPALADRNGWCWRIGVPKRSGIGSAEFKAAYERGLEDGVPDTESYSWMSKDILSEEEIASAKSEMTLKDFREQFEASWEQVGGLIFYAFDKETHVRDDLCQYRPHLPLHVGMDFNVDPMCWVVGQIVEDHPLNPGVKTLFVLDEIFIRNTNTLESLRELRKKFQGHQGRVVYCGDAASRQRRSSASTSDYLQIINSKLFDEQTVRIPRSNPGILNRFSVTNGIFMNADEQVRCYVNSKCKWLIHDLSYRAYKEGTTIPNDHGDIGHITDGLGYLAWAEFPMRIEGQKEQSIAIKGFK